MDWLASYLLPMDCVVFFLLSSVWLNVYYMSFFSKIETDVVHKQPESNKMEKDGILQFFEIIFVTITILALAQAISSYYDQYPDLLTGYTICCIIFLLGTDMLSPTKDEKKDEHS